MDHLLGVVGVVVVAAVVVEVPKEQLGERSVAHVAPSWFVGFPSYQLEHVGLGAVASGVELVFVTSEGLAEKSWIDDAAVVAGVAVVVDVAHTMDHFGAALEGIAVADRHSTSENSVAIGKLARHTFCVDRVQREMQQMLESWIAGYDMRWEGMVASFGRQP